MGNDTAGEFGQPDTLLDLDGDIFMMDAGYWVKFEAKSVTPSPPIPHGVRYSLALCDRNYVRVVGFDNAQAIKAKGRKRFSGRKVTWGHKHHTDQVEPYECESAGQLLDDFWKAVDRPAGG